MAFIIGKMCIVIDQDNRLVGFSYDTEIGAEGCKTYYIDVIPQEELEDMTTFRYTNGELVQDMELVWELVVERKTEELIYGYTQAIESGFEFELNGKTYHFPYDSEAQATYERNEKLLDKGLIKTVNLTVYREGVVERITVNKEIMDDITLVIYMHRETQITKLQDELMPRLQNAKTIEEIKAITW